MKIERENAPTVVIGKRVTVGAAINAVAVAVVDFNPDHAASIMSASLVITFIAQVAIARFLGVTTQ